MAKRCLETYFLEVRRYACMACTCTIMQSACMCVKHSSTQLTHSNVQGSRETLQCQPMHNRGKGTSYALMNSTLVLQTCGDWCIHNDAHHAHSFPTCCCVELNHSLLASGHASLFSQLPPGHPPSACIHLMRHTMHAAETGMARTRRQSKSRTSTWCVHTTHWEGWFQPCHLG